VSIDEPGEDDRAGRVQVVARVRPGQVADRGDPAAGHADVARDRSGARAIGDLAAPDDQVKSRHASDSPLSAPSDDNGGTSLPGKGA
jgi:hypothetical protein